MQRALQRGRIMKLKLLAALILATPLFFANVVNAKNPQDLQKLLTTGECVKCNL